MAGPVEVARVARTFVDFNVAPLPRVTWIIQIHRYTSSPHVGIKDPNWQYTEQA